MRRYAVGSSLCLATLSAACSGRDPDRLVERMRAIEREAQLGAALILILATFAWRFRLYPATWGCATLFVLHPTWWSSPYGGDCGTGHHDMTILSAIFAGAILVWDVFRRRPKPRRTLA